MRVWDLNPGYLNRQSLLGEHREIHAVFSIIENDKRGYARHPETLRWVGRLAALAHRHDLVVSEMTLRGYQHHSPVTGARDPAWPETYVDSPGAQFALLQAKYVDREPGRIPLPRNAQQLWAQHKYSVLARDPEAYRGLGQTLAQTDSGLSTEELAAELVGYLRERPPEGRLRNALQHLWGYVSDPADEEQGEVPDCPAAIISAVRHRAVKRQVVYLLQSTALSDLHTWISAGDGKENP